MAAIRSPVTATSPSRRSAPLPSMISTSRNRRLYVAEALVMSVLRGLAERVLHQIFGKKIVDVDQILAWHRRMDEGQLGAGEEYRRSEEDKSEIQSLMRIWY